MKLADDNRARVPFALVGVILLVSSAAVSTTMVEQSSTVDRSVTDAAVERTDAMARIAVETAAVQAAEDAAESPVIEPADTPYGRVLREETAFRDALEIRTYLAVQASLENVEYTSGDVRVDASLPGIADPDDLRVALDRVTVEPVGDAEFPTQVHVSVDDVAFSVMRDGCTVDGMRRPVTVVVSTPALALHDRTQQYERAMNAEPLADHRGLGARLTARLYPIAWTRGYAQYGGAPITNVVGNRHVEIAANDAALAVQRDTFGRADPGGRTAVRRAATRVAATDLLAGMQNHGDDWVDGLLDPPRHDDDDTWQASKYAAGSPRPEETVSVGVDDLADRTFQEFVTGDGQKPSFDAAAMSVYGVEARVQSDVVRIDAENRPPPVRDGWTLRDETATTTTIVTGVGSSTPAAPPGWDAHASYARTVVEQHTVVRYWERNGRIDRVEREWNETFNVELSVVGRPASSEYAPRRGIVSKYERGGPLDGPNLATAVDRADRQLVAGRGGADKVAKRAVAGTLDDDTRTVAARQPASLDRWLYTDLAELRDEVRAVSVRVERGRAGSVNPPGRLAAELRAERAVLVDAPETYGSVAGKARVAVRAAYLDRVIASLEAKAEQADATTRSVDDALDQAGAGSLAHADRIRDTRNTPAAARRNLSAGGPVGSLPVSVDASPSYLTVEPVAGSRIRGVPGDVTQHPLDARNVNVFATPYGDAADAVIDAVPDTDRRVDVATAARVLQATNRTAAQSENETLAQRQETLQRSVSSSVSAAQGNVLLALDDIGVPASERRAAVERGFGRWDTTHERALAVQNGSAAEAVMAELDDVHAWGSDRQRDEAVMAVRLAVTDQDTVRVPADTVEEATSVTRQVGEELARTAVEDGISHVGESMQKRWFGKTMATIPSGLPVLPSPGYWYATVNVWQVSVSGTYGEFTVQTPQGTPNRQGAAVSYRRVNEPVELDVTGDGELERLGRTTPVSFETKTTVVVVVPPGGRGVGDTDERDERSPGWPE